MRHGKFTSTVDDKIFLCTFQHVLN